MNQSELEIYFTWSVHAVRGLEPIIANQILVQNISVIRKVARNLLELSKYKPTKLYRGVLFNKEMTEIKPHRNFMYLSFSEEHNIAKWFADCGPNGFGCGAYGTDTKSVMGEHGYIIEYTPTLDEILFHWHFYGALPYMQTLANLGVDGRSLPRQKEVIVLQPPTPFRNLIKFDPKDKDYSPPPKSYEL